MIKTYDITAKALDPIYIGTGGYTIGRVDNTIVRDPITRIPKIPGTSVSGTWRYFMAIELQSLFKEENEVKYRSNRASRKDEKISNLFGNGVPEWVSEFEGNRYAAVKCAGQDDDPNKTLEDMKRNNTDAHCGHCIVCKSFGFSKKDRSEQGLVSFSDLNILLFPVYTRLGTRWITSEQILKDARCLENKKENLDKEIILVCKEEQKEEYLNLGWINLPIKDNDKFELTLPCECDIDKNKIVIVPDNLLSQIINSNLEIRTSVSIDPNTGAAKKGALFTSEAIPRSTCFYGNLNIFERPNGKDISSISYICEALCDSKKYYKTLGIGGMTTRGFGRLKMNLYNGKKCNSCDKKGESHG